MEFPHSNINNLIYSFEKYNAVYFRVPKAASTSLLITFRQIDNVEKLDTDYDKSFFKFAFVRNPFDRLASCFRHVIQQGSMQNIQGHPQLNRNMPFEQFVDVVSKISVEKMDIHFRPQYTFIPEEPGFVGRFESLQEDYLEVSKGIGIKNPPQLLHKNPTSKTIFKDYYSEKIRKKVVKLYKKDFELFNYSKELNL